ncbi:MAG TPA: DinB family protein [Vicinamibacterales bacterium]|nr:DinB family protein [Vicinamibacterales bacterium]
MNAEQASAIVELLTRTIESEGGATRKVIGAVPTGNRGYKPDAKSRSAWDIAVHIAMSDVWFADSILGGKFEWTGEPATPAEMTDPAAVARWHEKQMADRLAKLRMMSPDDMLRNVEFFGMKGPACTWLTMMNNHTIHHRGQLAAYLRAAGSKVPAIYGVSADENAFG